MGMKIKDYHNVWCQNQTALREFRFDVVVIDCNENQIKANSQSFEPTRLGLSVRMFIIYVMLSATQNSRERQWKMNENQFRL